MKIIPCQKCRCPVDATDAPEGAKIYCSDCAPDIPIPPPTFKKKKRRKHKNIKIYQSKEELPKNGTWVQMDDIIKLLNISKTTLNYQIQHKICRTAYLKDSPLLIDAKSVKIIERKSPYVDKSRKQPRRNYKSGAKSESKTN